VKRRTTDDKKSAGHCNRLTVSADMLHRVSFYFDILPFFLQRSPTENLIIYAEVPRLSRNCSATSFQYTKFVWKICIMHVDTDLFFTAKVGIQ